MNFSLKSFSQPTANDEFIILLERSFNGRNSHWSSHIIQNPSITFSAFTRIVKVTFWALRGTGSLVLNDLRRLALWLRVRQDSLFSIRFNSPKFTRAVRLYQLSYLPTSNISLILFRIRSNTESNHRRTIKYILQQWRTCKIRSIP